jgi:ribosome-associated heat shock protein Hsp15
MTRRELMRFLYLAEDSACELGCELLLSTDLGYISGQDQAGLGASLVSVKRMLGALIWRVEREDRIQSGTTDNRQTMTEDAVRLDKWLWAARFFKTRSAAVQAITAGRVEVNGAPAKAAKALAIGDRVRVRKPPFAFLVRVLMLSEQRGPAKQAAALYEEDPEGRAARERLAHQLRIAPTPAFEGKGRPTKRDRRELERLRDEQD